MEGLATLMSSLLRFLPSSPYPCSSCPTFWAR